MKPTYDVIVIGAGISGLVSACYLSKAGLKVAVVEQHDKPGGYFTSFKRKGFYFDAAAHSFGNYREGGHVRKILSDVGVSELIKIRRYDPSDIIITPDFNLTFWNDIELTIKDLPRNLQHEKESFSKFIKFLTSADQSEFVKLKDKTFEQLLRSFFSDERIVNALAMPVFGNGGLPPSLMHAFNGAKIFSEFILDGGYYPDGGIQNLPNALAAIIAQHGGDLLYKKRVNKVVHENGHISGIEVENGQKIFSSYVVSACDMVQTYKHLLGEKVLDQEGTARLDNMIPSLSTFILYIGIDKPFEGLPRAGSNIWYLPHYDLNAIYRHIENCNFEMAAAFMLRVAPDRKTVLAFIGAPFKSKLYWREHKKDVANSFLSRIETVIPGLSSHVAYFDAATPATLERYTSNHQGAAFGWAKTREQTFNIISSKFAPLKGLFFTGHWTSIGFGLPGTCYSGYETARRILRNHKSSKKMQSNA